MDQPFSVTNNSAAATAESQVVENSREKTALLQERKA